MEDLLDNPRLPRIQYIRALRQRAQRDRTGLYWIEGLRIVMEALQLQAPIETLVVAPELLRSAGAHELVHHQRQAGVACLEVSSGVFHSLSSKDGPQGLGAVMRQRWDTLPSSRENAGCWIALDAVDAPGTLGTLLRTADAVGATGVLLAGATLDPYDPQAARASMGALFTQRLVRTGFEEIVGWARRHHYHLAGITGEAADDYRAIAYPAPLVLLVSDEQEGLQNEWRDQCDMVVRVPAIGRSDVLDLAVATSLVLYEVFYQRGRSAL